MSDREKINQYLNALNRYLSRLDEVDAKEVIKEIESHIYDVMDMSEIKNQAVDIDLLLEGFGTPRELAQSYTSHVLEGTPPPSGFSAIKVVKHKVTKGLYWGTFFVGYSIGLTLILLGLIKLIFPDLVGMWSASEGQSIVIGYVAEMQPNTEELLGMWLIPFGIILGALVTRLTHSLLRILRRSIG